MGEEEEEEVHVVVPVPVAVGSSHPPRFDINPTEGGNDMDDHRRAASLVPLARTHLARDDEEEGGG